LCLVIQDYRDHLKSLNKSDINSFWLFSPLEL
jgi:hypothetical protein